MKLINRRANEGSQPGHRRDNFKLGLVVEGGGMRGVVSGAMLMALQDMGLKNCFDAVYGASAGAINSAYFLSGQSHGLDIYSEDLIDGRFLDFSGLLPSMPSSLASRAPARKPSRPVMDLDFLVDHIMRKTSRSLDFHAVMSSPVKLKVVTSSLDLLGPLVLDGFTCDQELGESLKASANVPEIAGPPRTVRGHRLVDAAVFEPVPIGSAVRDGCTHVMVLCTRPAAEQPTGLTKHVYRWMNDAVKNTVLYAPYMKDVWATEGAGNERMELDEQALYAAHTGCHHAARQELGSFVLPLYPQSVAGVGPMTTDHGKLMQARAEGYSAVGRMFSAAKMSAKLMQQQQPIQPHQQQQHQQNRMPIGSR